MPSRNLTPSSLWSTLGAVVIGLMGIFSFRNRGATARRLEEDDVERRRTA